MSSNISSRGGILGGSVKKSFWPLLPVLPLEALPAFAPLIELEPPMPSLLESLLACLNRPEIRENYY